jgi:trk system potassium uptake protein TrkA
MTRYAIIGLGRFGSTLAVALAADGADVLAIDSRRELVDAIADRVAHAVQLDATDERALRAQGVGEVDCAVVAIGENFEASVLATITCKSLGVKRVVARATSGQQLRILSLIGADLVLQPEEETARRLARQLLRPSILAIQELAQNLCAVQVAAPAMLIGPTLAELDVRKRYGVTLIAVRRAGQAADAPLVFPRPDTRIGDGDILYLVGTDEDVDVIAAADRD